MVFDNDLFVYKNNVRYVVNFLVSSMARSDDGSDIDSGVGLSSISMVASVVPLQYLL